MVQKVRNIVDWMLWREGMMLPLPMDRGRTVRLEVICETATAFRVGAEADFNEWKNSNSAKPFGQLIAVLPHGGQDIVEFYADGDILVEATSDGEVRFYCSENDQWWVDTSDEPTFTKPYERPLVDPAFRAMQLTMMRNMQAMERRIMEGAQRAVLLATPPKPKEPKADDKVGDDAAVAAAKTKGDQTGKKPGAGSEKPAKAPDGGDGLQSAPSGEGG